MTLEVEQAVGKRGSGAHSKRNSWEKGSNFALSKGTTFPLFSFLPRVMEENKKVQKELQFCHVPSHISLHSIVMW